MRPELYALGAQPGITALPTTPLMPLTRKKSYRPYLPLGLGSAHQFNVSSEGTLLDTAVRHKLPVPAGIILLDQGWQLALAEGTLRYKVADTADAHWQVEPTDPYRLINVLRMPNFDWEFPGPLLLRSLFLTEHAVLPGAWFGPINPQDTMLLAVSLCQVWNSAPNLMGIQRDVLLLHADASTTSGIARTGGSDSDAPVTLYQPDSTTLMLPQSSTQGLPPWALRLQSLLRDVRRRFSLGRRDSALWVEWVDDGQRIMIQRLAPASAEG